MPTNVTGLMEQGQRAMLDFLRADLDLGFTLLETARIEAGSDANHCRAALDKVHAALTTIRSFEPRIADREAWNAISARADQLASAVDPFND